MNTNSIFQDWSSEIYHDRNNLVFEDKNKAYGAYQIRREYSRSVILSFFIACISILTLTSVPIIVNYFIDRFGEREIPTLEGPTNLGPDIMLDQNLLKEITPPAEQKHELIQVATIQDGVPIVVNNIKPEESNYRDNASLSDKQSSTTTHEGGDNSIFIKDEIFDLDEEKKPEVELETMIMAEQMPTYNGGDEALMNYMKENVHYPSLERELGLSGTVYVYFIINKQGKVEDAKVIRGVRGAKGLDEEALRVISNMPDWTPGSHGGKPVKVQFTYPVSFRLK